MVDVVREENILIYFTNLMEILNCHLSDIQMTFSHFSLNFISFTSPLFISIEVLSVTTIMLSIKYKRSITCSV